MRFNFNWKQKTALFLASQGISLFGSSVVQFAIIWYVTRQTSSGLWVSVLTICACLPQFLISFIAGVWADRHSKKRLIIAADSAIAVTTLILALLLPRLGQGTPVLVALLVASAVRSLGAGVQMPAVGAMLPQLVPADQLMRVNGIHSTLQSIVQFAAPAAAGAILTVSALGTTLLIDIGTAIVGISLLCAVWLPKASCDATDKPVSVFADLRLGVRYSLSHPFLGRLLWLYGAFIFLCVPAGFLATLYVSRTWGSDYFYLSITELVGFAGMAAGGLLISIWGGFHNRMKTLCTGLIGFGALAIGMGISVHFPVYLTCMLLYGVALTMVQTATTTLVQEKATPDMQGRVFGFLSAIYSGFLPVGMAVFGPLCDAVPMRTIMIASGAALLLAAMLVRLSVRFFNSGVAESAE